jgi:ribosomal protein S18 acetylase RimI-like enzyme
MNTETRTRPGSAESLAEYGRVPILFTVTSVLRFREIPGPSPGIQLVEERLETPYVKDYDAYKEEGLVRWPKQFDVSGWGLFLAFEGSRHVGGAVVAPGSHLPDSPRDLATLFDIRIHPDFRRRGMGSGLLRSAADWAKGHGCALLKIETQNTNVPACRFYAAQGCRLGAIDQHVYAACPSCAHEVRLLWYLEL